MFGWLLVNWLVDFYLVSWLLGWLVGWLVGWMIGWLVSASISRTAGTHFITVTVPISKVRLCSNDAREDDGSFPTNEQHQNFITLKGTETRMQAPLCKSSLSSTTSFCNMLQIVVRASST